VQQAQPSGVVTVLGLHRLAVVDLLAEAPRKFNTTALDRSLVLPI
jgi:hypothetical protein